MDRYDLDAVRNALYDLDAQGGGTYRQDDLSPVRRNDGFAVAIGGAILPVDEVTELSLGYIAKAVAGEYMTDFVGTWLDDGKVYVDAVRIFLSRERAIAYGREHEQKAIYDFATGESVTL